MAALRPSASLVVGVAAILGGMVWIAGITWSTLVNGKREYEREGTGFHWVTHVVTDAPNPFLAVTVLALYLSHRQQMRWWGRLGALLAIVGFFGASLTGLAILASRGGGGLYEIAHPGENIFALVPIGLALFLVAMLRLDHVPRMWIWLILGGMPVGFALASLAYLPTRSIWVYLPVWWLYGIAWAWFGVIVLMRGVVSAWPLDDEAPVHDSDQERVGKEPGAPT